MYIMIDCTNFTVLARHKDYKALAGLAYIEYANIDTAIFIESEGKSYSMFTQDQLIRILRSLHPEVKHADHYVGIWKQIHDILVHEQLFVFAYYAERIEAQAQQIDYNNEEPYDFNPDGYQPRKRPSWKVWPNKNRSRLIHVARKLLKPSPLCQISANTGIMAERVEPLVPTVKPSLEYNMTENTATAETKEKAPRKVRQPDPNRVEQNGVRRPKAGGKCAQVWDIADDISASQKRPALSAEVFERGKSLGLNENNIRVEYQAWRKFNGLKSQRVLKADKPVEPKPPKVKAAPKVKAVPAVEAQSEAA